MSEYAILMAFSVKAGSKEEAMELIMEAHGHDSSFREEFMEPSGPVVCWWPAEDDRPTNADEDSAVFCTPGEQARATHLLYGAGLTTWNNVIKASPQRVISPQFEGKD